MADFRSSSFCLWVVAQCHPCPKLRLYILGMRENISTNVCIFFFDLVPLKYRKKTNYACFLYSNVYIHTQIYVYKLSALTARALCCHSSVLLTVFSTFHSTDVFQWHVPPRVLAYKSWRSLYVCCTYVLYIGYALPVNKHVFSAPKCVWSCHTYSLCNKALFSLCVAKLVSLIA